MEDSAFDTIDIIVNNSKYSPEYLKKLYIVDLYRILKRVEKTIKTNK